MSRWTNCRWELVTFDVTFIMDAGDRMTNAQTHTDVWKFWVPR
jgi:hypothetical protein